ncbi:methyltransferase domain-containing protein [Fodinicurvata sp. EGI_FJ10296]|uniref:methyltransferase domain-containing protein n=1 Tax=Fodinicurvata sp. EGI_FJ10296 TaxID=3231908 RepID=UPI003452EE6E
MTSWLHEQRLQAVLDAVGDCNPGTVLDLGCGDGDLLVRLATWPTVKAIVGIDLSAPSLRQLRARMAALEDRITASVDLIHGSLTENCRSLTGFDCAVLVETIEHIDPGRLAVVEQAVFGEMRPGRVVITTPNAEFNPVLGVPLHRFRHPDHRFEWGRDRFRRWARGVAGRHGYTGCCSDIAGTHPELGGASQMAVFDREDRR